MNQLRNDHQIYRISLMSELVIFAIINQHMIASVYTLVTLVIPSFRPSENSMLLM
jgi:hypothetical protein